MSKFALAFLLLFFGGIIIALTRFPAAAFAVYEVVYFMYPDTRWWAAGIPGLKYSMVSTLLIVFSFLLHYKSQKYNSWGEHGYFKIVLLILILYFLLYNTAIVPQYHLKFTIEYLKLIVVTSIAYKTISSETALKLCTWIYILGCAYIAYEVSLKGRNSQGRVEGIGMVDTGGDSNAASAALVPSLSILLFYCWKGTVKSRLTAAFFAAIIANGIVLLNSRGAFLGTVAGCGYLLTHMIFSKHQLKGQRGTALMLVVVAVLGFLYVADAAFWERMATLKEVDDGSASGSHRVEFWLATFDVLDDYPLGVGIWGYKTISQEYLPAHYFTETLTGKAVHSTWFQILNELGWIGFALAMAMLFSIFRSTAMAKKRCLKNRLNEYYFLIISYEASIISFLVTVSFISSFRAVSLYILISLTLALCSVVNKKKRKEDESTTIHNT